MALRLHDIHITFIFLPLRLVCHDSAYLESWNKFTSPSFLYTTHSSLLILPLLSHFIGDCNVLAKLKNLHSYVIFYHTLPFNFTQPLFSATFKPQILQTQCPANTKTYGKFPIDSSLPFPSPLLQLSNFPPIYVLQRHKGWSP